MATPRWSERALTVSEVTRRLQGAIEPSFRGLEVRGEVVGARATAAGHVYFTLKDAGAQMPCVFWRTALARHPGRVEDGMQVVAAGDIQVYAPHGRYQLVVQRLADIGLGALLARIDELKRKLHAEGLFEPAKKRAPPFLPRKIGLVTAATGAALHDFVVTARRRYPASIVLCACRVQGELAAASIAGAIRALARRPGVDVIVVARGGGSALDLLPFSEERVVRAIAQCPVPVVSAVGHEIDTTLADLAADRRAATPTAAAELVVPRRDELVRELARRRRAFLTATERLVAERRQSLDERVARLERSLARRLDRARRQLAAQREHLLAQHPRVRLGAMRVRQLRAEARLKNASQRHLLRLFQRARVQAERLRLLSPLGSLDRGWALVRRQSGSIVRQVTDVTAGEDVSILMRDGTLVARILNIEGQAPETGEREEGEDR
jgi:exodeoxyribonuclease VII large subunit